MNESICDFLLVAALPKEFHPAIHNVFDVNRVPKKNEDARNYYQCTQNTEFGRRYYLRLFCIGRQGGQNTVSAVTQAVLKYRPRYVVLFGIAAIQPGGNRHRGDMLVSEWIADFEEVKRKRGDAKLRPFLWRCERELFSHIEEFKNHSQKTVHVGCIISQPNLSRCAKYRNWLVRHMTVFLNRDIVIGLEMEGGGLAKAIDGLSRHLRPGFILIKGAVDFGNYHKNDAIQQNVAVEVAKFVKDFLASEPVAPMSEARSLNLTEVPCQLVPEPEFNTYGVYLGDESQNENGSFRIWATFNFVIGHHNLELISLWVGYYVQGCLCLGGAGSISLGHQTFQSHLGHMALNNPLKLNAKSTYTVKFSGSQRPPLMQQTPDSIKAEYGDLVLEAKCRLAEEYDFRSMRWVFRFNRSQAMEEVQEIRNPPRLSDGELHTWKSRGRISEKQHQQLLAVSPSTRYLVSIVRRKSGITAGIPHTILELLKSLYQEGLSDSLRST